MSIVDERLKKYIKDDSTFEQQTISSPIDRLNKYIIPNSVENDNNLEDKSLLKTASAGLQYFGQGILSGLEGTFVDLPLQIAAGARKLFGDNEGAKGLMDFANISLTNTLINKASGNETNPYLNNNQNLWNKEVDKNSYIKENNLGGKIIGGIGEMLPMIGVGKALSGGKKIKKIGSNVMLGSKAFSGATNEAYGESRNMGTSMLYGLGNAGTEILTEMFGGGIPGLKQINGTTKKEIAKNYLKSTIGEGLEEVVSSLANPLLQTTYKGKDSLNQYGEGDYWKDVLESGLVGSAIGGVLDSPNTINSLRNRSINSIGNVDVQNNLNNKKYNAIEGGEQYSYIPTKNEKSNKFKQSVSKYFNNSPETITFANTIDKIIQDKNYNVVFDDKIVNQNGNPVNAQIKTLDNGEIEIKINPNSQRAGEFLLTHEITHAIETDSIKNLVLDYASKHADFNNALESLKQSYGVNDVSSEVLADISGQLFGNQEFINNLSVEKPSVFKKIYNKIVELANKITGNSKESLFIRDLKNKWEEAYRTQSNNLSESKFSIQADVNGKRYVNVDTNQDIFSGKTLAEQNKIAKKYILDTFRENGILLDNEIINITSKTANEYTHPKNNLNKDSMSAKMKASTELDNLLAISTYEYSKADDGRHGIAKDGWDYYKTVFKIGDNVFEGLINIAKNNNNKTLYDVTRIKKTSLVGLDDKTSSTARATSFSKNNIPQNNKDVKSGTLPKYSMQNNKNNAWKEHLEKNYKSTGIITNMQDIRLENELPIVEKQKNNNQIKSNTTSSTSKKDSNKIAKLLDKRPITSKPTFKDNYNKVIREMVDKGEAINRLAKKTGNKELYAKYDHMGTAEAEGHYAIATAQTDNHGNKIGKSIVEIWKPVENSGLVEEFSNYLLHKHNISRYKQGKPVFGNSVTSEVSQKFVNDSEKQYPQFKEWAKDVNTYNRNQMQNMVDAGLTSQESQEYLNSTYENYIRIYRDVRGNSPITQFKGNLKINVPIKKAKGGNENILPLKDSMAQQTIEIKKAIRRNEFGLELLNVLGNGKNVEYDGKQQVVKNDDGTYSFTVFKEGKPIKMEIDEGIYEALKPSDNNNPKLLAPVRTLSKIQRGLLTDKNPLFIATNFFKDIGDAPFNSKYGSKFVKNYVIAAKEIKNNGELWNKYKALGGEQNTYFDYDKGVKMPSNSKAVRVVQKIQSLNQIIEQLPRFTEFISTLESGGTEAQAMYNAAEITTNFKRGGDFAKALNRNGANFLNASIQGFDKQIRNFTNQNGAKGYINLLAKATILGVLPSVLNHLLLDDDEDYQALPDYIKDSYYLFKTGDGNFIRIPKGRVVSTFGMAARRTLEYASGEKDAYSGMLGQMSNQVAPNNPLEDNIFAPILAVKNNRSWNGSEIVPQRLQNELAENQYDEKTDSISRTIGKIFKVSPKKVNYILDQYTGGIGDLVLPALSPEANQNPISAKFSVNSIMNNKNVSDFYDKKEEFIKISNSPNATEEDKIKAKYFNSVSAEMNELYKQKREIQNSNISNKEKLKQVKEIQTQINDITKFALEDYENMAVYNNYAYIGNKEFYKNTKDEWTKMSNKLLENIADLNMNPSEKQEYFNLRYDVSKINSNKEKDSIEKKKEISDLLLKAELSEKQLAHLYSNYYSSKKTLDVILETQIPIKEFIKYNSQNFESDYNEKGIVSGSRKKKNFNYINSLNLSAVQKAILMKIEYSSFSSYDNAISNHINKLNLTKFEKASLAKKIGFSNYDKYLIEYIKSQDLSSEEKKKQLEDLGFTVKNGRIYR